MMKTAAAITILAATTLAGQYVNPTTRQSIKNNAEAEKQRQDLLRAAFSLDTTYENCLQSQQRMRHPNPHVCEKFKIQANAKRAEAAAVKAVPARLSQPQQPMHANYDPARAANRQYPVGSRPALPPQMVPTAGQVAQGVWHGVQNGQTTFQEDPNKIAGQPAVDFRNRSGGNAGGQNGQSTFGGSDHPSYYPRYSRPGVQPHGQQHPKLQQPRQVRQGRYVRGRMVY